MALKDIWTDKVDRRDDVVAKDINDIAAAVMALEENGGSGGSVTIDTEMSDTSENPVQNKVVKKYVDDMVGDIETALDSIIAIQNSLIGGESA